MEVIVNGKKMEIEQCPNCKAFKVIGKPCACEKVKSQSKGEIK